MRLRLWFGKKDPGAGAAWDSAQCIVCVGVTGGEAGSARHGQGRRAGPQESSGAMALGVPPAAARPTPGAVDSKRVDCGLLCPAPAPRPRGASVPGDGWVPELGLGTKKARSAAWFSSVSAGCCPSRRAAVGFRMQRVVQWRGTAPTSRFMPFLMVHWLIKRS